MTHASNPASRPTVPVQMAARVAGVSRPRVQTLGDPVRTSKSGKKSLSLSIKPKQDKPAASKKPRADDFDDEISF